MSQQELLKTVVSALDAAGVDYMITGSVVSSLQGEPRVTHDIDFVVQMHPNSIPTFAAGFAVDRYYLDRASIATAIAQSRMFNLVDIHTGAKADVWMLTASAFDQSRFARRRTEEFLGMQIRVSTPEDTILAKLRWTLLSGGSEKQFIDALRVYEVQYGQLDMGYLEQWVARLDLAHVWQRLKREAEPL